MNFELGWIYLFNIIFNSILSFYTSIFLVFLFLFFLKITNPRIKTFCYALPFYKVILDLFFYQFSNWALAMNINPILARIGTRTLYFQINFLGEFQIKLCMQNGSTFSLADVIALHINPLWIRIIVMMTVVGSLAAFVIFVVYTIRNLLHIHSIVQNAKPMHRVIMHPQLRSQFIQKKAKCLITTEIHSPCVVGKTLLFPSNLMDFLSQEEFEAIIAHELSHMQWKDSYVRMTCKLIETIFWWLFAKWWYARLENYQERASDQAIQRFEISKFDLMGAIVKTTKNFQKATISKEPKKSTLTKPKSQFFKFFGYISFVEHSTYFMSRMRAILQYEHKKTALIWKALQYGMLALGLHAILFGKMWIF